MHMWHSIMHIDLVLQVCQEEARHAYTHLPWGWATNYQIRAPEKCILGAPSRGTYSYRVTVYSYNEYIGSINPIIQYVTSLTWTINYMRANWYAPKHATTQPLYDSNIGRGVGTNLGSESAEWAKRGVIVSVDTWSRGIVRNWHLADYLKRP